MTLSHRFKSSPAIPGNATDFRAAGYMMMAGHFRKNHVSSGDLNRGRRTESRVLFGYFLHDAKSDNSFSLQRTSRFSKPRFSLLQWRFRTNKIKTFPKGDSRFCKPQFSAQNFAQTKLNPLPLCLLETWSPCSRPFAILPVSAVSDTQKLATGNFLCVRAASLGAMPPFCVACGGLFLLFVKYKKWGKKLCNFPFGKFVPSETAHAAYFYLHSTRKPCKKT